MRDLPPAFRDIPSGVELIERLTEAFSSHRGWIQAVGLVEDVELKVAGSRSDVRRAFRGRFTLAQLSGPLGGPYGATLARIDGERPELLGGVLVRAISAGVSALCVSAEIRPTSEAESPLGTLARAPAVAAAHPTERATAPRSAFAARVGALRPPENEADAVPELPDRGDLVEHFAFGLCEVLKVEGDRLVLRDLRNPGRIREIASEKLSISGPLEHAGKRLYKLSRR